MIDPPSDRIPAAAGSGRPDLALITGIASLLPARAPIPRLRSEIDYYGTSHLIANLTGLPTAPKSLAAWIHGWISYPLPFTEYFMHTVPVAQQHSVPILVGNHRMETFLREQGFSNAINVGLPYTYVPAYTVPRLPNSLLIMPSHTLFNLRLSKENRGEREYLEMLKPWFGKFDFVAMCVYADCLGHGFWMDAAAELGIPIFSGADIHDANTLTRMRTLFDLFSHMTTNAIGSHVVYGMLAGQKVSWVGDAPALTREELLTHPFSRKHPAIVDYRLRLRDEGYAEKTYGWLRKAPPEGVCDTAWAREESGADSKIPPLEIAKLLGWADELARVS